MSTRSTRRPHVQPLAPLESLLLAQAAWQLGAGLNSWPAIAKLLSKHPLLSRPKSFFTSQSCHAMYEQLIKDAELDLNDLDDNPHAPINLKLAEKHYRSRHNELRDLILEEESKFKVILKEIDDIRAGHWDKTIKAKLSGQPDTSIEPSKEDGLDKTQPLNENFDGSELSRVTDSADSFSPSSQLKDETNVLNSTAAQNESQEVKIPTMVLEQEVHQVPADSTLSSLVETAEVSAETITQDEHMPSTAETISKHDSSPTSEGDNTAASLPDSSVKEVHHEDDIHMEDQTSPNGQQLADESVPEPTEHREIQKQEEEEEINKEDLDREEEEVSQGQSEGVDMEINRANEENQNSCETSAQAQGVEGLNRDHTPAIEAAISEVEPAEEPSSSSEEEPIVPARRSTRRRKSSTAPVLLPTTRKRLRSQARLSETEPQLAVDSENDNDDEDAKEEDTPQPDDERSSPFDGPASRRRAGKRKASFMDSIDSPMDKKRIREDSEPVDEDEAGPSSHNTRTRITRHGTRTEEQVALKRFQNVIGMLHSQISQHRNGNIFHNPIKNSEAPDYHEIVKRPMDLKTIKTRVKDGLIANSLEFQRDIFLMFANSMMYNRPGSDVYTMAEDMMLESEGQIIAFRQTEGLVKRGQRQP
ncbi:Bromodomain-containing protein [Pholiota conissans]|uniref:Bromodomain-containing protein n=1 Tax=Pholiota conissans TaxID=109636 RepID=A0A9P5ZCS8_9AGAR|nr:Bromodomain-containing protein [Pholiota conissans]